MCLPIRGRFNKLDKARQSALTKKYMKEGLSEEVARERALDKIIDEGRKKQADSAKKTEAKKDKEDEQIK